MEPQESTAGSHPQVTLLIENPKKNSNWGPLLRCCAAFGIEQIFVVGYDTCSVQGSHGASKHVELLSFPTHQQAVDTLKQHNYQLLGLLNGVANAYQKDGYEVQTLDQISSHDRTKMEKVATVLSSLSHNDTAKSSTTTTTSSSSVLPKSFPVTCHPFFENKNTCLVVGKRTFGLPLILAEHCQRFVHIPHQAELKLETDDNASQKLTSWLNGEACVSIILHEFSAWAGFHNTNYQGQKYRVARIVKGAPENQQDKHNERKRKMEERMQEEQEDLGNFFSADDKDGDY